jgi:DNA (cytosine-5)-methyltransferase 1
MSAYYNEFEPYAAQWLRNLIVARLIPQGEVDTRSIVDVRPLDLAGYTQCHFFAGLGGWAYALRLAGWPDDRPIWTGSCPCQPFSVAGQGKGEADERHLWPAFFDLIRACRPPVVMGERVAAAVGKSWLDGVFTDLEGAGYSCEAAVLPACAVDAPHRRDRLWFVADAARELPYGTGAEGHGRIEPSNSRDVADADSAGRIARIGYDQTARYRHSVAAACGADRGDVGDALGSGLEGRARHVADGNQPRWIGEIARGPAASSGSGGSVADADGALAERGAWARSGSGEAEGRWPSGQPDGHRHASPWDGAGWILGYDGKARRIPQSGIRLLAHGVPARVGRLRAYGNAIVPQVAAEVIAAFMECRP